MAAQSQIVQIQPSTLDLAATGVHLVPLDDIGHADIVEAIIGEDRAMVALVLPYGVLVVNGSSKKLTAIAVTFRGLNAEGQKKRVIIKLRLYPPGIMPSAPGVIPPIAPGASLLFTPVSLVNQYLALPPTDRKGFLPGAQIALVVGARTGVSIFPGRRAPDFPSYLQQRLSILQLATDVQVYLEGAAFDDDSYAGSQHTFDFFKTRTPTLHR